MYADTADPDDPNAHDRDWDGVPDWLDNCVFDVNPSQGDQDRDNIGDACDADRDGDGIMAPYDCDDRAPFILDDLDLDGSCDRVADMPFHRGWLNCTDIQDCCQKIYDYSWMHGESYTLAGCLERATYIDNCRDEATFSFDRPCTRVRAWAIPGAKGLDDPQDNYWPHADRDACGWMYYNSNQDDSDGDGTGDHCQLQFVASRPRLAGLYQWIVPEQCGPFCLVFSSCPLPTADVTFRAEGGPVVWPFQPLNDAASQPVTIGACGCPNGQEWTEACKLQHCPELGEYGLLSAPNIPAWRPVLSDDCEAMEELPDRWVNTYYHADFIQAGGPPQHRECKIRPVLYNHGLFENSVRVTGPPTSTPWRARPPWHGSPTPIRATSSTPTAAALPRRRSATG